MIQNSKYGGQLSKLKTELKYIEETLGKEERLNCKRSNICLILSLFLTATVIIITVFWGSKHITLEADESKWFFYISGASLIIHIINFILVCVLQKEFYLSLLLCTIPPFFFFALFVEIYIIVRESIFNTREWKRKKSMLIHKKSYIIKLKNDKNAIENKIKEFEVYINNAFKLYNRAITEKSFDLMQQAAAEGDDNAIRYLKNQKERELKEKAAELYKQATSGDTVDKELLKQAAELGHTDANLSLGKELLDKGVSNQYTKTEKTGLIKKAQKHFRIALDNKNIEGEFLYMLCSIICDECEQISNLSVALIRTRTIKEQKLLPKNYEYNIDFLLEKLVEAIDKAEEFKKRKNTVVLGDDFIERADKEYKRMLGISDEPTTVWVDINTGLPY